ncbi:hypothetical protein G9A89_001384 [Geosiphon pyriformis]|nr:hypothetical protein G9A89_001384 [Geosiphon pyriformis]
MIIPARLSEDRFIQLLLRLQFLSCLDLVRKVMFLNSTITGKAAIMLLEQCEKIQKISFIGCQKIIIPSLTSKLVEWKVNETYESPKLFCFQNFVFSRCAGGSRHALTINKINSDLQILRSEPNSRPSIFQVTECNDPNCEQCTSECGNCGVKYNFCDSFWMNCRWCNKRQFCGPCVAFRGSPTNNAFAYMRLKICHLFNIPCPE